ncbi:tRNA wybutosine-synthesizing protein 3 homolog isoform X1 [Tachyglossus aculeatus]|uniref:tRNA wybutosine-synthesizing protein 3 homolog isoform X1 n=1 Tax=Tachyglossus aculeatus TaxID=9261 RepID=UPI0018F7737F|nr:tRNA wybutosine-synthesizing protein 3 homolog isoform X1 [Tachyglossus aculeatus]
MSSGGHRVAAMASCSGAGPQGFGHRKAQALGRADGSRKGSVDAAAAELVRSLNRQHRFCTTSSCAGRMLLVDRDSDHFEIQKQNCSWLLVTHQLLEKDDLILALQKASGNAVLKFEPFVLHVLCRELQDAQLLHSVAIASGFRNSGITVGKKGKIMMAVRSTHVLEVPLCRKGKLMVSQEYIDFLIQIANEKMEENKRRIERFYNCLQLALKTEETPNDATAEKTPVVYTRRRKKNPERVQDSRVSAEKADTRLESDGDSETNLDFFLEKY